MRINRRPGKRHAQLITIDIGGVVERSTTRMAAHAHGRSRTAQTAHAHAGRAPPLLVTVVRGKGGDGHAVLTVKTDKGELVLDNQNEEILLWSETVTAS